MSVITKKPWVLVLVFLLVFALCSNFKSLGAEYFDFSLSSGLFEKEKEFEVSLNYSLVNYKNEDFWLVPVGKNCSVYVINSVSEMWVSQNSLISEMPDLSNVAKVKISSSSSKTVEIGFKIVNKKSGEVYLTPTKTLYDKSYYGAYIKGLHIDSVSEFKENFEPEKNLESEETLGSRNYLETEQSQSQSQSQKKIYLIAYASLFSIGIFFGFKSKKPFKMLKFKNERLWNVKQN